MLVSNPSHKAVAIRQTMAAASAVCLFLAALWILDREISGIHFADVMTRLRELPWISVTLSLGYMLASYLALAGYDWLALRHIGRRLPLANVLSSSFIATAVGLNLGMAMLSGGAVRYRLYSAAGLSATEIATVIGLIGVTFAIGVSFVLGLTLLLEPTPVSLILPLPAAGLQLLGALLLGLVSSYAVAGAIRRQPIRVRNWQIKLPAPGTALLQLLFAVADIACAAAVLHALLPAEAAVSYPRLLCVYTLAISAGLISHVPGGLGGFESALLLGLPDVPKDVLLGSAIAYRAVYFLLPFVLAAALGLSNELASKHSTAGRGIKLAATVSARVSPQILAAVSFCAGAILMFSGATPVLGERLEMLQALVPLAVVEISHMAASLAGLALMLLAHGLYRRVNAAYHLTFWALVIGMVASVAKGLDYEEAALTAMVLTALYLGRRGFHRRASMLTLELSPGWIALVVMAIAGSLWLGLFAYRNVAYSHELWWHFAVQGDAPRFLRATMVVVLAGTTYSLLRLMQPHVPEPILPDRSELEKARRIARASPCSHSALAMLGDKCLLFNENGDAFVMYQVRGSSWIAMGDPVGPENARESLAWQFREICDTHGGRSIFYQVDADNLAMYVDMGLALLKLGEEALVPLEGFSLQGAARAEMRQIQRRIQREGGSFEVIEPDRVAEHLPRLREISDEWLAAKGVREKGFSLGRFEPAYISSCHCALVRLNGRIVAFANLWAGDGRTEVSVDLMRYAAEAPKGTMDYLFTELFLWASAVGYQRFNLGMAPLSGLETHPLAPLWHRIGTLVYRHGDNFYNFEGLRAYKAKFKPEWRPKYLAAPRGLALPSVLLDISALISGGLKGLLGR